MRYIDIHVAVCFRNQVVGEMLEGGSYLAHIPLEQYGALVIGESEEALQIATDNFSISAIKVMMIS